MSATGKRRKMNGSTVVSPPATSPADVPDANLRQEDCRFSCRIHLTLAECEALAEGTMPETVQQALQAECAAHLPVIRGETIAWRRRLRSDPPAVN